MTSAAGSLAGRLRRAANVRFGLRLELDSDAALATVVLRRAEARGMRPDDYLRRLEGPSGADLARDVVDDLVVPESAFFRYRDHFLGLDRMWVERPEKPRWNVLSAGCAGGEEPYTVAIVAAARFGDAAPRRVDVRAVDVSPRRLAHARAGMYGAWALRDVAATDRARWFRREAGGWTVRPELRALVKFEERNLAAETAAAWPDGAFDAIFCRNVLMYLTPEIARAATARFERALAPGGVLFLGHAETLRGLSEAFEAVPCGDGFVYRRRADAASSAGASEAAATVDAGPAWIEAIAAATRRVCAAAGAGSAAPAPPAAAAGPHRNARARRALVINLLRAERFAEAAEALGSAENDPGDAALRAAVLAQAGRFAEAEVACRALLAAGRRTTTAHYVLALCREAAGDDADARRHLAAAAEGDAAFALPPLRRGLAARREGDRETARRELRRAGALLACERPRRLALFGGAFGREALAALCRSEASALGGEE
ncbi:MAG TPA: CheR family methyltransferase [Planctomycetota bacterium]|nr:CheR family methyltransferase [Planctomycetota bacterium]